MALWTQNPKKAHYVNSYFASMSSMATRIVETKESIKSSYADRWNNIPCNEQDEIVDKYIITPDATARYRGVQSSMEPLKNVESVFPKLVMQTGQSCVKRMDEAKEQEIIFQDEHSDPFAWETKSQMNMPMPPPVTVKKTSNGVAPVKVRKQSAGSKEKSSKEKLRTENDSNPLSPMADITNATGTFNNTDDQEKPAPIKLRYVSVSTSSKHGNRNHGNNHTDERNPSSTRTYNLPTTDHRQPSSYQKNRSNSSKINPRSSLTLDGAIRNLEVALKEQNKYVEMNKMKVSRQSSNPRQVTDPETYKKISSDESVSHERTSSVESQEYSPLLHRSQVSPTPSNSSAGVRKSGFDFLDNW
uniref:DUF4706 domain-containing protein n=1 Tax=Ciona savignyi TaxID=51511 RepID=H2YIF7_CIOSA